MADARDSKSRERKLMWVRLPPPAPGVSKKGMADLPAGQQAGPDEHRDAERHVGSSPTSGTTEQ